jgi:hypothetical protein
MKNAKGFSSPPVRIIKAVELRDVVGEQPCDRPRREPLHVAEVHAHRDVEPGRERDEPKAGRKRQLELEPVMHHQHGDGLADDREPAQRDQRLEAHCTRRMRGLIGSKRGHAGQDSGDARGMLTPSVAPGAACGCPSDTRMK